MAEVVREFDDFHKGDRMQVFDDGRVVVYSGGKLSFSYLPSAVAKEMAAASAIANKWKPDEEDVQSLLDDLGVSGTAAKMLAQTASRGGHEGTSAMKELIRLRDEMRNTGSDLSRPDVGTICPVCESVTEYFSNKKDRDNYNAFKKVIVDAFLKEPSE